MCLNKPVNKDCEDDPKDRRDAEMDRKTEGQGQHSHVKDDGAGQTEGFSVVEPGKRAVCSEIADKAAEHGSDQYKQNEHPCAL